MTKPKKPGEPRGPNKKLGEKGPNLYASRRFTKRRKKEFLKVLEKTGSLPQARATIGVTQNTVRAHTDPISEYYDKWFDQAIDEANALYRSNLVGEAQKRAIEGIEEQLSYKGELTGQTVNKKSDQLLLALLKAYVPEFKDKVQVDQRSLNVNAQVGDWMKDMPDEARDKLREVLEATRRRLGDDPDVPGMSEASEDK